MKNLRNVSIGASPRIDPLDDFRIGRWRVVEVEAYSQRMSGSIHYPQKAQQPEARLTFSEWVLPLDAFRL